MDRSFMGAGHIHVVRGSLTSFSCNIASNGFAQNTSWVLGSGGEQVTEYAVSGGASTWQHTSRAPQVARERWNQS